MPVIAFNIDRMLAEKISQVTKDTKVENNMRINDVGIVPRRGNIIKFDFEFTTEYKKDVGNLKINGNLLYSDDEKKIKDILDIWRKTKRVDKDIMTSITNFILIKCNVKALMLSELVNLPPHIRLPMLDTGPKKVEKGDYIG